MLFQEEEEVVKTQHHKYNNRTRLYIYLLKNGAKINKKWNFWKTSDIFKSLTTITNSYDQL